MTYNSIINNEKMTEWKLGATTGYVMAVFADLESWATRLKSNDADDDNVYYLLYREKILKDLPYLGSVTSISRALKELESKDIIKCIHKNSTPAYCLTAKGLGWKRKPDAEKNANDGDLPPDEKKDTKAPKAFKFQLSRSTGLDKLSLEYMEKLFPKCMEIGAKYELGNAAQCKEEFEKFLLHYSKVGSKFANWSSAFSIWCDNHRKFKKTTNGGENANGLYR